MSILIKIINNLCCLSFLPEYLNFKKSCKHIRKTQLLKLDNYVKKNVNTEYGEKYNFDKINSYDDYKKYVPITSYEDYQPYINKICDGEKNVLTAEDVTLLELTSGSSSGKKLIPYTKTLKHEFKCGINPWLYDIYKNFKGVKSGKSYWSITPVTDKKSYTKCGIPIGFEEDSEYLGGMMRFFYKSIFAVSSDVKFADDINDFYFKTCSQLLSCRELSLISVWNPEYLNILLNFMTDNAEKLTLSLPKAYRDATYKHLKNRSYTNVFPNLKVISCWADSSAKRYYDTICNTFPKVIIQPKGLLATECFISFPLHNFDTAVLSANSHFFEFMHTETKNIYLADELEINQSYEVIVTTGGGFYRYLMHDIIKVTHIQNGVPQFVFIGRSNKTSDMFGEKISEGFVSNALNRLDKITSFYMLSPQCDHYVLYIKTDENISCELIDNLLSENYHYDYCRKLSQLKCVRIFMLNGEPYKVYIDRMKNEMGQRLGDIKPSVLSLLSDWDKYFDGFYTDE